MAEEKVTAVEETVEKKAPAKKAAAKKPAAEKKTAAKKPAAKKAPAKKAAASSVTIKLVKSLIARSTKQIATANSLGLKKVGDIVTQPVNAATQGKINVISHMVEVTNA